MTPYSRSKQKLESEGYLVARTEHWNSFVHRRQDMFGIIDMVAIKETETGVLGVQVTSGSNVSSHIIKANGIDAVRVWCTAGNRFQIHGWRKIGAKGKRKVWDCRIIDFPGDVRGGPADRAK